MKRPAKVVFVSLVVTVAACTDKPVEKTSLTSPGRPRLTMSSLPASASTVCAAAVKERDGLLAAVRNPKSVARIDALDALVEDTCY
jgi:hypothetical protein